MSEHAKEPWTAVDNSWEITTIHDADSNIVCEVPIDSEVTEETQSKFESLKEANARRIVAAVNACAGIPTYQLTAEDGNPTKLGEMIDHLRIKRDELLDDIAEESAVREKLATLLAETAVALKGQEAALFRHSWHDLAEVAGKVVAQRDELLAALERIECEPINAEFMAREAIDRAKGGA